MTTLVKYLIGAGIVVIAVLLLLNRCGNKNDIKVALLNQQATQQAQEAKSAADAGAGDVKHAEAQKIIIVQDQKGNQTIDAKIAADRARVAKLAPLPVQPATTPAATDSQPVAEPVESDREVAKDQLITDLTGALAVRDKTISDQAALIVNLNDAVTHYKGAYDDEVKADSTRQIALKAEVSAARAEKWKWGIIGFAVGAGAGYAAGRIN